jgi:hypothetical protein
VAAPAALLLAVGLLSLRIFAPAARGCGALSAKGRGVVFPLASWELGRDPLPRARLALLLVLATGLGAYATVYDATLDKAAQQRAAFQVGADARRDIVAGPLPGEPGTDVWRGQVTMGQSISPVSTLGIDPSVFGKVLAWPTDGSYASAMADLQSKDTPAALAIPDGTANLTFHLTVTSNPDQLVPVPAPGRIVLRVTDGNGQFANVPTSAFTPDAGEVSTVALLPPGSRAVDALIFDQPDGGAFVGGFQLHLREVLADGKPIDAFAPGTWHPVTAQGQCHGRTFHQSVEEAADGLNLAFTGANFYDCSPVGLSAWVDSPLPVVISRSVAADQGWRPGQDVDLRIAGAGGMTTFKAHINGVADRFATLAPDDQLQLTSGAPSGFVVADLKGLDHRWARTPGWSAIAPATSRPLASETWAAGEPQLPVATTGLLRRDAVAKSIQQAPLQQALQGATLAGVGMALLVALGSLGAQLALSARRRRRQLGVLRSIGLDRTQLLGVLGVEFMLLAGLALLIAIPTGIVLLRVLLPFIDLGGDGRAVVPPTHMVVPTFRLAFLAFGVLLATALAVCVALVAAVQARLHDVLRLGDD